MLLPQPVDIKVNYLQKLNEKIFISPDFHSQIHFPCIFLFHLTHYKHEKGSGLGTSSCAFFNCLLTNQAIRLSIINTYFLYE